MFTRLLGDYLTVEGYGEMQRALMNPEMGDLMPGTGGIRKVRWKTPVAAKASEAD